MVNARALLRPLVATALGLALASPVALAATPASATDVAPASRPHGPGLMVALGDSVPAGSATDDPPFVQLLGERAQVEVRNHAVGGYTTADVRRQLDQPEVLADLSTATQVILMVGANDFAEASIDDPVATEQRLAGLDDSLDGLVERIRQVTSAPIVMVGYWNISTDGAAGAALGPERVEAARTVTDLVDDTIRDVAVAHDLRYADTRGPFRNPEVDPTTLLAEDGDHPNGAGHRAIADQVEPELG